MRKVRLKEDERIVMKVNRVEQHIIHKTHGAFSIIDKLSFKSKNIYNYANYVVRQEFIRNNKWIRYNELANMIKNSEPYRDLGSNVGQQTLKVLDKNWKSFFVGIRGWSKNKNKYKGRPKLPNYKDKEKGRFPLIIDNIKFTIVDEYLRFSWKPLKELNNTFRTNVKGKLLQVRFIPKSNNYIMEIVYEVDTPEVKRISNRIASIDIGINNLATVSNNFDQQPFIINGKPLKSINQFYNKKKSNTSSDLKIRHDKNWSNKLQRLTDKRFNKIKDYIHKSSKNIVDWCIENNADTLVIGKNKEWKQEINIGKRNNQNFVSIPFEMLISQLEYKCENVGIKFVETEESYTSGTSFLDKETPIKTNYNKSRRIKRGLFKSNEGVIINADLNGSYQIMKKVFPEAFADGIEGAGLHPVRVNPI